MKKMKQSISYQLYTSCPDLAGLCPLLLLHSVTFSCSPDCTVQDSIGTTMMVHAREREERGWRGDERGEQLDEKRKQNTEEM
jgi:hypothetical protein